MSEEVNGVFVRLPLSDEQKQAAVRAVASDALGGAAP